MADQGQPAGQQEQNPRQRIRSTKAPSCCHNTAYYELEACQDVDTSALKGPGHLPQGDTTRLSRKWRGHLYQEEMGSACDPSSGFQPAAYLSPLLGELRMNTTSTGRATWWGERRHVRGSHVRHRQQGGSQSLDCVVSKPGFESQVCRSASWSWGSLHFSLLDVCIS